MRYQNPVLRGMYPDPSVCAANGKYYMVCSTFQYFPGAPLFESEDMVNWRQIGHCLTRADQLDLRGESSRGGVYAPTIRYNDGRFYMITTKVAGGRNVNFYVYTDDIYGEWSEPVYVEGSGIDPSLYFEDGRAWFIGNGIDEASGRGCILMSEIDILTGRKLGGTKPLWFGTGGRYIEAPHLYKTGGYYYLVDAEGGTEYGHMVNYARSRDMWGPYEPFPGNPVMTNRDLGGYIIQGAGHGDLIEDKHGDWWFVHLAFRQQSMWMPFHHLGRETCLAPVCWQDGWFHIGDGTAGSEYVLDRPGCAQQSLSFDKGFADFREGRDWCFLRYHTAGTYTFRADGLRIRGAADTPDGLGLPACAMLRQSEFDMNISVNVSGCCGEAGVTLYLDERHHYDLYLERGNDAVLRLRVGGILHEAFRTEVKGRATLKIRADAANYEFFIEDESGLTKAGSAETRYLSSEVAGGFTGVMIGLYAVDAGGAYADFSGLRLTHEQD